MHTIKAAQAAALLWQAWQEGQRLDTLPAALQPADRAQGYAIQAEIERLAGQARRGWKIAATSTAGQVHIGVDGPLAGRLLQHSLCQVGATVSLAANLMHVAEAEFAFRMARALPPQAQPYTMADVVAAVDSLHPAIELPDSRYRDFARVGAPQLIADNACAGWFILGAATTASWRTRELATHEVTMRRHGTSARTGTGANVLGNPWTALTWIANELSRYGPGLLAGEIVTTGTCIVPLDIAPGDRLVADFGDFGCVEVVVV
jgi:2-keto-4-pentenoate hydratase